MSLLNGQVAGGVEAAKVGDDGQSLIALHIWPVLVTSPLLKQARMCKRLWMEQASGSLPCPLHNLPSFCFEWSVQRDCWAASPLNLYFLFCILLSALNLKCFFSWQCVGTTFFVNDPWPLLHACHIWTAQTEPLSQTLIAYESSSCQLHTLG